MKEISKTVRERGRSDIISGNVVQREEHCVGWRTTGMEVQRRKGRNI